VRGAAAPEDVCKEPRRPQGTDFIDKACILMRKLSLLLSVAAVIAIAVGLVVLAAWDIPAPTAHVEKVIPDDRFPK
jgi:hypothetical protein